MDTSKFYQELMKSNPFEVGEPIVNSKGQKIFFYENFDNPDFTVVAACHELKVAANTNFFDCSDFGEDSEYNPVFVDGKLISEFEL